MTSISTRAAATHRYARLADQGALMAAEILRPLSLPALRILRWGCCSSGSVP